MNNHFPGFEATPTERAHLNNHTLTRQLELEAAMCAWEYFLENTPPNWPEGAGQLRLCAGAIASAIHYGWCITTREEKDYLHGSYDWDFVPWFIKTCVDMQSPGATVSGSPDLAPDWVDMCRKHNQPTAYQLLRDAKQLLNLIPNFCGSYDLAARIERFLIS